MCRGDNWLNSQLEYKFSISKCDQNLIFFLDVGSHAAEVLKSTSQRYFQIIMNSTNDFQVVAKNWVHTFVWLSDVIETVD